MNDVNKNELSPADWDELNHPRPEGCDFDQVVEEAISRRGFLSGVLAFGSGAAVMWTGLLSSTTAARAETSPRFAFKPIPIATDFDVHVPEGYSSSVVVRWDDPPISKAAVFDPETGHDVDAAQYIRSLAKALTRVSPTSTRKTCSTRPMG
ncbi:MAG: hypothetical protein ABJI96_03860 [Paracoccaceae bacterium]